LHDQQRGYRFRDALLVVRRVVGGEVVDMAVHVHAEMAPLTPGGRLRSTARRVGRTRKEHGSLSFQADVLVGRGVEVIGDEPEA